MSLNPINLHEAIITDDAEQFISHYGNRSIAEFNQKNAHGESIIQVAAQLKHKEAVVEFLLNKCVDLTGSNHKGETLLHHLCRRGSIKLIQQLIPLLTLEAFLAKDQESRTAFYRSCEAGHVSTVKLMLKSSPITVYDRTCFEIALKNRHFSILENLVSQNLLDQADLLETLKLAASLGRTLLVKQILDLKLPIRVQAILEDITLKNDSNSLVVKALLDELHNDSRAWYWNLLLHSKSSHIYTIKNHFESVIYSQAKPSMLPVTVPEQDAMKVDRKMPLVESFRDCQPLILYSITTAMRAYQAAGDLMKAKRRRARLDAIYYEIILPHLLSTTFAEPAYLWAARCGVLHELEAELPVGDSRQTALDAALFESLHYGHGDLVDLLLMRGARLTMKGVESVITGGFLDILRKLPLESSGINIEHAAHYTGDLNRPLCQGYLYSLLPKQEPPSLPIQSTPLSVATEALSDQEPHAENTIENPVYRGLNQWLVASRVKSSSMQAKQILIAAILRKLRYEPSKEISSFLLKPISLTVADFNANEIKRLHQEKIKLESFPTLLDALNWHRHRFSQGWTSSAQLFFRAKKDDVSDKDKVLLLLHSTLQRLHRIKKPGRSTKSKISELILAFETIQSIPNDSDLQTLLSKQLGSGLHQQSLLEILSTHRDGKHHRKVTQSIKDLQAITDANRVTDLLTQARA